MHDLRSIVGWVVGYAAMAILQYVLFDKILLIGVSPDALFVAVVMAVARFGQVGGMFMGFFVGLVYDVFNGTIGAQAFSKTMVAFVAGFFFKEASDSKKKLSKILIIVFVVGVFEMIIKIMLYNILEIREWDIVVLQVVMSGLLDVVVAMSAIKAIPSIRSAYY